MNNEYFGLEDQEFWIMKYELWKTNKNWYE